MKTSKLTPERFRLHSIQVTARSQVPEWKNPANITPITLDLNPKLTLKPNPNQPWSGRVHG